MFVPVASTAPEGSNTRDSGIIRMAESKEEWLKRMSATLAVDPEDLLEVAAMFFETIEERLDSIVAAGASGDLETMTRLAHGLKGDAANIGFVAISRLARDLETQGRSREVMNFDEQLVALRAATKSTKESLDL
jgi:HPt (histidine-containing phosphotransfer) domain-containing protein